MEEQPYPPKRPPPFRPCRSYGQFTTHPLFSLLRDEIPITKEMEDWGAKNIMVVGVVVWIMTQMTHHQRTKRKIYCVAGIADRLHIFSPTAPSHPNVTRVLELATTPINVPRIQPRSLHYFSEGCIVIIAMMKDTPRNIVRRKVAGYMALREPLSFPSTPSLRPLSSAEGGTLTGFVQPRLPAHITYHLQEEVLLFQVPPPQQHPHINTTIFHYRRQGR